MQAKQRASPFWDCQPPSSIAIYRRYARFAVAQAGQEGNPGLKTAGNLAISVKYAKETVGLSGARLLRDRQTARNSRIPISKGAAEMRPRYCVGVVRHSTHDGIAGKG